ncbi:MAG: flagellar biosynthetic protein FliR [Pseudoxanthomonas sp.]
MDAATAMVLDGNRAFAMIGAVLWIMLRTGAMLMAMPLVGTRAVPARVRVLLAGTLSVALAPILPPLPAWGGFNAVTVLSILREVSLGVAMGFMLRLVFEAGAFAGELVSQGMGLSFAQMADPLRGTNSGVTSQWFYLAFGLMFFASDGHLAMISLLVRSYQALPVGMAIPDVNAMLAVAPDFLPAVLRGGLSLALPIMIAMLATNLAFGVLAKAAPQLNPVQLGLPVALLMGMSLLAVMMGDISSPVLRLFEAAFEASGRVTHP